MARPKPQKKQKSFQAKPQKRRNASTSEQPPSKKFAKPTKSDLEDSLTVQKKRAKPKKEKSDVSTAIREKSGEKQTSNQGSTSSKAGNNNVESTPSEKKPLQSILKKSPQPTEINTDYEMIVAANAERNLERDQRTIRLQLTKKFGRMSDNQLKALHTGILHANQNRKNAFLLFESMQARDEAFTRLKTTTINRQPVKAFKAEFNQDEKPKNHLSKFLDLCKLHVGSLRASDKTEQQLKEAFPSSESIEVQKTSAMITFANTSDAFEAFKKSADLKIDGAYAFVRYPAGKKQENTVKEQKSVVFADESGKGKSLSSVQVFEPEESEDADGDAMQGHLDEEELDQLFLDEIDYSAFEDGDFEDDEFEDESDLEESPKTNVKPKPIVTLKQLMEKAEALKKGDDGSVTLDQVLEAISNDEDDTSEEDSDDESDDSDEAETQEDR